MAFDVRAHRAGANASRIGTARGRRQESGWALFLIVASMVGLIVLTMGMSFASLPLLGCVELILLITLCTGIAMARRKETPRTVQERPSGRAADALAKPAPTAPGPRSRATSGTALIMIQEEPEPADRRDHAGLGRAWDDEPYGELRTSSVEMAERIRALMEADGWQVRVEQLTEH